MREQIPAGNALPRLLVGDALQLAVIPLDLSAIRAYEEAGFDEL